MTSSLDAVDGLGVTGRAEPEDTPRDDAAPQARELRRGDGVGRYVILSRVGQGGMGVVYAAYDPDLDRKVALKLMLAEFSAGPEGRAQLLREAQAMAQVAHPNVVTVHDVGALGERVWVALEFVDGQTLSSWLRSAAQGWREVLAMFLHAGQGLVAVHEAGLVHRDLKPDNIMIGRDGRVRIMDFGLARRTRGAAADPSLSVVAHRLDARVEATLTHAGRVIGTPLYMAPEQWQDGETDARTDQFALCVALWGALYRAHPFEHSTLLKLAGAVIEGKLEEPPASARVPRWLHRILARGLEREPARRWDSVSDLLDALRKGQAQARIRRLGVGLVGLALLAGGLFAWQRHAWTREAAHAALQEEVRRAADAEAELVREVLQVRLGLLHNYDPLLARQRELLAASAAIRRRVEALGGPRVALVLRGAELREETTEELLDLAERFKTHHSVLRNSSLYFPVLAAELTELAARRELPRLSPRLLSLLQEVLRFNLGAADHLSAELSDALTELEGQTGRALPQEIRDRLHLLVLHARIILEHKPAVESQIQELARIQDDRRDAELLAAIAANRAAEIEPLDVARWALVLAFLGLGGYSLAWLVSWGRLRARLGLRRPRG